MAKTGKRLKKAYDGIDPDAPPLAVEAACKMVIGSARSMGIDVVGS